ncbi:MAG: translation initiation factor Sui1 [Anaerolineaceae bacterium]|nr:translation initiation factor Sui1 [Anaerolineaceae bacterium]
MVRKDESRTVYTTEAGRICPNCARPITLCQCKKLAVPAAGDGIVRVGLEKKGRGGKTVSVISGLSSSAEEIRQITSEMKRRCGTGGTLKDGVIEIQGDHRDLLIEILKGKGIRAKRTGG